MARRIEDRRLREALDKENLEDIYLFKAKGYFYIVSDKRLFKNDSIYGVEKFNQLSISYWIELIKDLTNEDNVY